MVAMRRTSILLLAASCGLSFVVLCLGACLAAPAAAAHACCEQEDGFRAAARDCCVVTQGVSPAPTHVAPATSVVFSLPVYVAVLLAPVVTNADPATLASSPPLILRI
jgi:hypothetical protein